MCVPGCMCVNKQVQVKHRDIDSIIPLFDHLVNVPGSGIICEKNRINPRSHGLAF